MVNWVNAYDITTVAWGDYIQGDFNDPSQTTPVGGYSYYSCSSGLCSPSNELLCVINTLGSGPCDTAQCFTPQVQRSQYLIPVPTAYFVVAYGTNMQGTAAGGPGCGSGGEWLSAGCVYPLQSAGNYPLLVDLPIPDNTMDTAILVQGYYLGIVVPGAPDPPYGILGSEISFVPDLTSLTPSTAGVAGFGPSWSPTTCDASPDDPFDGDPPP
jgi:hypothetical protein